MARRDGDGVLILFKVQYRVPGIIILMMYPGTVKTVDYFNFLMIPMQCQPHKRRVSRYEVYTGIRYKTQWVSSV